MALQNKLFNPLKTTRSFERVSANIRFHNLLAEAAKNHVYIIVMGSIMAVVRELIAATARRKRRLYLHSNTPRVS
jgi:DNA-binding FadR family transcriptional regulator